MEAFRHRFAFIEEAEGKLELRPSQLGAIHQVLGYWSTNKREPTIVVMPLGTGKTDVMIALLAAGRIEYLLVLAPSDAVRTQRTEKFLRLGVLQRFGVIAPTCLRPVVGLVK